jgi:hypothetical protein
MKSITKLSAILLAAAACAAWPVMAQTNSTPNTTNTAPAAPRPPKAMSYHGVILSVDSTSMTLTLKARAGETKVKITSATKIRKDGQPAQFSDAAEGMRVSGSGKKGDDGIWTANTLNILTKPAPKAPAAATPPAAPPAAGQ